MRCYIQTVFSADFFNLALGYRLYPIAFYIHDHQFYLMIIILFQAGKYLLKYYCAALDPFSVFNLNRSIKPIMNKMLMLSTPYLECPET